MAGAATSEPQTSVDVPPMSESSKSPSITDSSAVCNNTDEWSTSKPSQLPSSDAVNNDEERTLSEVEAMDGFTIPKEHLPGGVPDYGWRVPLIYQCPIKCKPFFRPRLRQIPSLVGLGYRYCKLWLKKQKDGRKPYIDHMNALTYQPIYGAPIGGIGCGTIGRGYRGEFCRFQLVPGYYDHTTVVADQFIVCIRKKNVTVHQQVLCVRKHKKGCLDSWNWNLKGEDATYHALYPRAWTIYKIPEHKVQLICRQVSPIYPHEYKDTSFPCAVFVWSVENLGEEDIDVSIMFTFKNGRGVKEDSQGGCWNQFFYESKDPAAEAVSGVTIHQTIQNMACTYGIAARHQADVSVSHSVFFDPKGSGDKIWKDLSEDGELTKSDANIEMKSKETAKNQECAAAVCCKCHVPAGSGTKQMEFCLSWDMPVVHFKSKGQSYGRRYSRWFGQKGDAAPQLCAYALQNYSNWEQKIEEWQGPILENLNLPAWYKSALFNELYFVSDGGTVWVDPINQDDISNKPETQLPKVIEEYGKFAYLEGHEYRMYNTYDVHHYASFALVMLWPKLQLSLQYDIAKSIDQEDHTVVEYLMEGGRGPVKLANAVPHDLGDPEDEPWTKVNAYNMHPTHNWKDLNLKFVLQVYRDYSAMKDMTYLKDMYPKVKAMMDAALVWDVDGDGLIENGGFADQTFDAWTATGASAYCGGMWLAALRLTVEMANILEDSESQKKYSEILEKGKAAFEKKLWNGHYYNYDSSTAPYHDSIMAAQLMGQWFMKASGITDDSVFPPDKVESVLKVIYQHNVMKINGGTCGAINGGRLDRKKETSNCQAEEFWVGIVYSLAANMIQEGLCKEGFQTAWGAYHMCWEILGLAFQTPEAYTTDKVYRSLGYMRPLAIWSMHWALLKFHPQLFTSTMQSLTL